MTGILISLNYCRDLNLTEVIIESDSLIAINLIKKKQLSRNWKLSTILLKILAIRSDLSVTFQHQFREANAAADWLATTSLRDQSSLYFTPTEIPIPLRNLIFLDKNHAPYIRNAHSSGFRPP